MTIPRSLCALALVVCVILTSAPSHGQAPKSGGWLTLRLREDLPQGFAIHESPTISTMWPAMPCFSNLVLFDPRKPSHSPDTIIGELAERWSWQENYRKLVFLLRRDVKWHDGHPFTSSDVKYTFDVLREMPGAPAKLRLNPRREWYGNIESLEAPDPGTVVFRLKRPQPSLILMLASGFTPIYAAHVPPVSYRTGCVDTGPFKLKGWRTGEFVEYVRNTDYFVKDRPHLDGLRYVIIDQRGTATAALEAGRVDAAFPGETPKPIADELKRAAPRLVITPVATSVVDHLVIDTRKPPFDNVRARQAVSRGIDRRALIRAVYQGGAVLGTSLLPRPYGSWGMLENELRPLAGYGEPAGEKAQARKLLTESGVGGGRPLKVELLTRGLPAFADIASFVAAELRRLGIEASVRQVESSQWYPLQARGEFQLGVDRNGVEPDDPDASYYEYFGCRSSRNASGYCSDELARLIDEQSQELDVRKRRLLVLGIEKRLEELAIRPVLDWRLDYFTMWPHVKNLVPHHSIYGWGRMQDVWRDK